MANIKDIARLAGVSVATVSRALAHPEVVRPATISRVRTAIDALEYRPNGLASGLRRQKSDNILVAVPGIENQFYAGVVRGIEAVAHDSGYKILLGETKNSQARLDGYAEMLRRKEADGLILLGALTPTMMTSEGKSGGEAGLPVVMACEYYTGAEQPSVRIDNRAAAREAVEHLTALGHSAIGHISGPPGNPLSRERRSGFELAISAAGLKVPRKLAATGDYSVRSGYEAMKSLLGRAVRPTAVFCDNDAMAIGALRAIDEAGLGVPADISVMGFDDLEFAEFSIPPLTTIAQPHVEIGASAMRLMLDRLNGAEGASHEVVLPHHLVVRSSTGPVKALRSTIIPPGRASGE